MHPEQKPRTLDIRQNYNQKAQFRENEDIRQQKQTNQALKFNNWIKSVLISQYSKEACQKLTKILDLPRQQKVPILHVLDIGCGRGQDILKWKLARVKYMVATDFSEESIKAYEQRWRDRKVGQPFRLHLVTADFTKLDLYYKIQHSFYDLVSAQFCLHYMFKSAADLNTGLATALSNLLIGGVFIATIPDAYTIMKKINQKGKFRDGFTYYDNKYFSLRFPKTKFTQKFGNQYGFYLQDSIGKKDTETGQIIYTTQWLISLDALEEVLNKHGVVIEYTKNFIEFYLQMREVQQYKRLFSKVGLIFEDGKAMEPELWEIVHLYRVLVCRKKDKGEAMNTYTIDKRLASIKSKQLPRRAQDNRGSYNDRGGRYSNNHSNNHHSNSRGKPYYNNNSSNKNHYNNRQG